MNAPPVLRPLRAILQRRLDPAPPTDSSAEESAKKPTPDTPASATPSPAQETQDVNSEEHLEPPERPEAAKGDIEVQQAEPTEFAQVVPGEPVADSEVAGIEPSSLKETALPRWNDALIKSAFQQVKTASAEIETGISEVIAQQIEAAEAATATEQLEEITIPRPDRAFMRSEMQELETLSAQIQASLQQSAELGEGDEVQAAQQVGSAAVSAETAASLAALSDEMVKAAEEVRETEEVGSGETEISEPAVFTATEAQDVVNEKIATTELDEAPSQESSKQSEAPTAAVKSQTEKSQRDNLMAATEEEMERLAEEGAAELVQTTEDGVPEEPSRLPRNVQAYYLQPLRREAQYNVPSCNLQLRSYSVRPLESFCDFAMRAAYYLGLPAYGPTPLPKIIQRWTVPKASFIFKKSQENFERITRRRLIQIRDGHPETVQIWLAFLQKHQQAGVGMKANVWEFSGLDVAKELDKAYEEAKPLIDEKLNLLGQDREIATVEKVDEILTSQRYKLAGGR
ncbi:mitochondrial 37S ribosomal protein rsm10 [Diaporthe australafricana]|uniref:Mitochondrial 37S ribosomal protein rsm10 n=1 Tax=Diaporthe australafricana TaxID=127596 RepID=A0ABR3W8L7_9PEZI